MKNGRAEMNYATHPSYNVWVGANAGSGKTHILCQRVLSLLLAKIEPAKILCLTYTKAAANEMKLRVFNNLAQWTQLRDEDLKQHLGPFGPDIDLKYARQIFAKVQDTPGGLKIQTIHSFCELLLHNFCLEADMERHFTLTADFKQLKEQALLYLMEDRLAAPDLEFILQFINNNAFNKLFEEIAQNSNKFEQYLAQLDLTYLDSEDLIEFNKVIYRLIDRFLFYFKSLKNLHAYVSFDDLIYRVKDLLYKDNFASWVHYKLDKGIDHVLIDEAQDTNPVQWAIIQALINEFFAGDGQKEEKRSVFAVGDEKQSILSFQGSVATDFAKNGLIVKKKALTARQNYHEEALEYSFRSAPIILEAVDKLFNVSQNYVGLTSKNTPTSHKATRENSNAYLEFWDEVIDEESMAASAKLAKAMAERIEELIKHENAEPKDILILVAKRTGSFCSEILYELKKRQIEVAGLDRLNLYNHIAIRDLCALGRFALHQYDDLALANIFKSPILGLTEEDLYNIAVGRETSLWQALQDQAKIRPDLQPIVHLLKKYCRLAPALSPFDFYSEVLGSDGGRKKILSRLGHEANDVLGEFLNLCLDEDQGNANLYSFLDRIEKGDIEIKRELLSGNEVRIMTVHGAKGLEAPIVFIAYRYWRKPNIFPGFLDIKNKAPIFLPDSSYKTELLKNILQEKAEQEKDENKRLLYVAMTRARDKLFICSYNKTHNEKSDNWHNMIKQALTLEQAPKTLWGSQKISRCYYGAAPRKQAKTTKATEAPEIQLPLCLLEQEINQEKIVPNLRPSAQKTAKNPKLREKGVLKHKLLQYLPAIKPEDRPFFAQKLISSLAPNIEDADEIIDKILGLLNDKNYQMLFSAESLAEIAIAGQVEIAGVVHNIEGQIDRIIHQKNRIIFCEYKTGKVPRNLSVIPKKHLFQIALYYKLLYNYKKEIVPILLYTEELKSFILEKESLEEILMRSSGVS